MKAKWFALAMAMLMAIPFFVMAESTAYRDDIYDPGTLKPIDSALKVNVGDPAPGFSLPAVGGQTISLESYKGQKHVVISFVPAAWTPVCSDQWPGYNLLETMFRERDTILLGISVDNIPTLHSWTKQMGNLWFPVLSDFWPHGKTAEAYGVLRSDGIAERALFLIDKQGFIRYAHVSDINVRPRLENLIQALEKLAP